MKKNIVLESYNDLFLVKKPFDYTHVSREDIERIVDDLINDDFDNGIITVGGYKLTPSECLKKCDPLAYNEFFLKYCDSQKLEENNDGTFYDHMHDELTEDHIEESDLAKECCHCCGKEYLHQELNPETGYCFTCQEDELLNGPKEFRPDEDDDEVTIIIKESAMKRWKKCHKLSKKNKK